MAHMFVPGPVDVEPEILTAQAQPMLPHRSKEFETIFRRCWEKAQQLFRTQSRVFITASSGTGLQEAAVRNLARRDVLSCVNGAFSQRWYEVALSNGKQADVLAAVGRYPVEALEASVRYLAYELGGRELTVNEARERPRRSGGGFGGGARRDHW